MRDQVVESCDCVDEETECTGGRVQGEEWIQQVLSVDGNVSEQFAISVITDTGESCHSPQVRCCFNLCIKLHCENFST